MAEYDEDDELDDDGPDLSERAWEIGQVPRGRFHGLMVIAAALVAPQIANPDDCVARMGEIVAGRTLELAELADADDGRSARRFEALEREVQALAAALSSGVSVVDTIARVLEVVGPLRWRHCANDLRLEYVGDGWGDESDWQADAARYELMTSVEGALRLR